MVIVTMVTVKLVATVPSFTAWYNTNESRFTQLITIAIYQLYNKYSYIYVAMLLNYSYKYTTSQLYIYLVVDLYQVSVD